MRRSEIFFILLETTSDHMPPSTPTEHTRDEVLTFEGSKDHDEKQFTTTHSLLHPQMMSLELCTLDFPSV